MPSQIKHPIFTGFITGILVCAIVIGSIYLYFTIPVKEEQAPNTDATLTFISEGTYVCYKLEIDSEKEGSCHIYCGDVLLVPLNTDGTFTYGIGHTEYDITFLSPPNGITDNIRVVHDTNVI